MKKGILIIIFQFFLCSLANAQLFPPPAANAEPVDSENFSRTLHLLNSSTAKQKNTVKVAVYGQSISVQDWSKEIEQFLRTTYPEANLIFKNLAIGGFSAQILHKMVHQDICAFYPDLVLFHVYGNDKFYEKIIQEIRSHTIAEIGLQTDHFHGDREWNNEMSYQIIPALAKKYDCQLIKIRDPWKAYLQQNDLEYKALLKDNVHLNDHGNFLMAELIKPYLARQNAPENFETDLIQTLEIGKDLQIHNNRIKHLFYGNRAELVFEITESSAADFEIGIRIDRKPPSQIADTYFQSRPYNENGDGFPWNMGSMIATNQISDWVEEKWKLEFKQIGNPYDTFTYEITGSETGFDGSGSNMHDFISHSGRVVIRAGGVEEGGDWHVARSHKVLGTETSSGDEIFWNTYSISKDRIKTLEQNPVVVFQGTLNDYHEIELIISGDTPFKEVSFYRSPFELIDNVPVTE